METTLKKKQTEAIRELLRGLRTRKCLSQGQVYDSSGVDVSKYESNQCAPKVTSIMSLCETYEIDFVGFWLVYQLYLEEKVSFDVAIDLLDQWEKHRAAVEMVFEMMTKQV